MAAMNTAFRSNLISPALMARMGGPEGATQSAMQEALPRLQDPLCQYYGLQRILRQENRGESGNMAQFGGRIASNPLEMAGQHELHGDALTSAHERPGTSGEQRLLSQIAMDASWGCNKGRKARCRSGVSNTDKNNGSDSGSCKGQNSGDCSS